MWQLVGDYLSSIDHHPNVPLLHLVKHIVPLERRDRPVRHLLEHVVLELPFGLRLYAGRRIGLWLFGHKHAVAVPEPDAGGPNVDHGHMVVRRLVGLDAGRRAADPDPRGRRLAEPQPAPHPHAGLLERPRKLVTPREAGGVGLVGEIRAADQTLFELPPFRPGKDRFLSFRPVALNALGPRAIREPAIRHPAFNPRLRVEVFGPAGDGCRFLGVQLKACGCEQQRDGTLFRKGFHFWAVVPRNSRCRSNSNAGPELVPGLTVTRRPDVECRHRAGARGEHHARHADHERARRTG